MTTDEDLRSRILELYKKKNKMMTARDVARDLNIDHRTAKQALTELINEGALEFTSFGGATFIKMVEPTSPPTPLPGGEGR